MFNLLFTIIYYKIKVEQWKIFLLNKQTKKFED